MKKNTLSLFLVICISQFGFSQLATVSFSDEIPESASITGASVLNSQFSNSYMYYMAHGLTVFNQQEELMLLDKKTFYISKKIPYPKYKEYDDFMNSKYGKFLSLKQNQILIYKKKNNDKSFDITAIRLNENFVVPDSPKPIFNIKNLDSVCITSNEEKDICIFSGTDKHKKENIFYYNVLDNNLKSLKTDSIIFNPEIERFFAIPYNDGYAICKKTISDLEIKVTNLKTNKTLNTTIKCNENKLLVAKIKRLANGKLIVCGSYTASNGKKKIKNGVFRFIINLDNSAIEESILFENIPAGEAELEKEEKNVESICMDETGTCYIILDEKNFEGLKIKKELFCIGNNNIKWKKQLPISSLNNPVFMVLINNLYIVYKDCEKDLDGIDYNHYVYGKPYPAHCGINTSVLKIASNGFINHERFAAVPSSGFGYFGDGIILGVTQGTHGPTASKCKIVKFLIE